MAQQTIDVGTPNGGNGDTVRDAFVKTEANFVELYAPITRLDWFNSVDDTEYIITLEGDPFMHTYTPSLVGDTTPYYRNLFIGSNAGNFTLSSVTAEARNLIAIGAEALSSITTAKENIAIGNETLGLSTTGGMNTGVGAAALYSNTTGTRNTAVGRQAGVWVKGSNNIFLGSTAGFAKVGGGSLTAIDSAILIGSFANGTQSSTGEIAIGHQVNGQGSNTAVIGGSGIIGLRLGNASYVPAVAKDLTPKDYVDGLVTNVAYTNIDNDFSVGQTINVVTDAVYALSIKGDGDRGDGGSIALYDSLDVQGLTLTTSSGGHAFITTAAGAGDMFISSGATGSSALFGGVGIKLQANTGNLVEIINNSTGLTQASFNVTTGLFNQRTGFTVTGLPAGTVGDRTYVTDTITTTFGSTAVTGGSLTMPVFFNGINWIIG
jgi:hypothetical protein